MLHKFLSLLAISMLFFLPFCYNDLGSDRAALVALRAAVGGRTLLWDINQQSPCFWRGVQCESNRVTALRLPGFTLSGELPSGILGNLTELRTLSLRFNMLTGQVPSDLALCTNLRNLYLQENKFSGQIPEPLFSLGDLVRLNLASNGFTGGIPLSFNNLARLRTVFLENNQLTGSIPSDLNLPKLEQFNVSNNQLNGSIPDSLKTFATSSFLGTSLCGKPLQACSEAITLPPTTPTSGSQGNDNEAKKKGKKLSGAAVAGIAIGSVFAFLLIVVLLICLCRKRNRTRRSLDIPAAKPPVTDLRAEKSSASEAENGGSNGHSAAAVVVAAATVAGGKGGGGGEGATEPNSKKLVFFGNSAKAFDLEDLLRASAEVLGKGTFGTTYKAVLEFGTVMTVKRLKDVNVSAKEFKEKIEAVGAMDHESLAPLRAYYYNNDEKLLVHDYMPMGSLSALLHGNKGAGRTPLNWVTRSNIALGAARGIEYLHSQGSTFSHGNIKSSNILLTQSYQARVSDFGLAHLVGTSTTTPIRVAGYRAPEVTDPRKVSQKADIYSFGVLLLELLTGKAPAHTLINEEGVDLPRWVQSIVREEWSSEVFDLELQRDTNVEEDMVKLLQLGIDCAAQFPDNRPTMSEVRVQIEEIIHSTGQKG